MSQLVERLLVDLSRLGYGEPVGLDYAGRRAADAIVEAYEGYMRSGCRVETDFGDACSGTAYLDDDDSQPVLVDVELEDRTVVCSRDGSRTTPARDLWRLDLVLDGRCERILELDVRPWAG